MGNIGYSYDSIHPNRDPLWTNGIGINNNSIMDYSMSSETKVHWPPRNKFASKLHGYIVYFSSTLVPFLRIWNHLLQDVKKNYRQTCLTWIDVVENTMPKIIWNWVMMSLKKCGLLAWRLYNEDIIACLAANIPAVDCLINVGPYDWKGWLGLIGASDLYQKILSTVEPTKICTQVNDIVTICGRLCQFGLDR